MPLVRLSTGASRLDEARRARPTTARNPALGTATSTAAAPSQAARATTSRPAPSGKARSAGVAGVAARRVDLAVRARRAVPRAGPGRSRARRRRCPTSLHRARRPAGPSRSEPTAGASRGCPVTWLGAGGARSDRRRTAASSSPSRRSPRPRADSRGVLDGPTRARARPRRWPPTCSRRRAPLPVCVACDDDEVAAFAVSNGAAVVLDAGARAQRRRRGGRRAPRDARRRLRHRRARATFPLATGIGVLEHFDGVTIAPDRRRRGTNLLRVPTVGALRDALRARLAARAPRRVRAARPRVRRAPRARRPRLRRRRPERPRTSS